MVSVVIPALNEAEVLAQTLDGVVRAAGGGEEHETIVVDGGSVDGTLEIARARGCLCVSSPRAQRAAQMNAGAARASGDILVFLHADTLLPAGALTRVAAACKVPGVVGGGFARRYDSRSRWLRLTCWLAEQRNRWIGWHLGDQAIFVRRPIFERLGGFGDHNVFEDVDFSRRLGREGRLATLRPPVISSARRFAAQGVFGRSLTDAWLMWRYLWGASPHDLRHSARPVVPAVEAMRRNAEDVEQ